MDPGSELRFQLGDTEEHHIEVIEATGLRALTQCVLALAV